MINSNKKCIADFAQVLEDNVQAFVQNNYPQIQSLYLQSQTNLEKSRFKTKEL